MSNAAATVPGNTDNYLRNKTMKHVTPKKSPGNLIREKALTKPARTRKKPLITTTYEVTKGKNRLEEEETWMQKSRLAKPSGLDLGNTETSNGIHSHAKRSDDSNALSDNTHSMKMMSIPEYEQLSNGYRHLQVENGQFKVRIAALEQETSKVLGEFNALNKEHEQLRKKMDTGKEPLLETYSRVYEDRKILRDAEKGYRKQIVRLEQELNESKDTIEKLTFELEKAKSDTVKLKEQQVNQTKLSKLQWENKGLKKEVQTLKASIEEGSSDTYRKGPKSFVRTFKKQIEQHANIPRRTDIPKVTFTKEKDESHYTRNKFDYEYYLPDSDLYY